MRRVAPGSALGFILYLPPVDPARVMNPLMQRFIPRRDFDFGAYLSVLRQFSRSQRVSPAVALGWTRDGLLDWPSALLRAERIISSMTTIERSQPEAMDEASRSRIAADAGATLDEVESLLTRFFLMRDRVRELESMSLWRRFKILFLGR